MRTSVWSMIFSSPNVARSALALFAPFFMATATQAQQWTVVNLHPAGATESSAAGVFGDQQVGYAVIGGVRHASLWSGSAASWVDLHPAGTTFSQALGVRDGQQVGEAHIAGAPRASLWSGSSASWVDLHPAGDVLSTVAVGAATGRQVGFGTACSEFDCATGAALWSGSGASLVSLHPEGTLDSYAYSVSGAQQVGSVGVGSPGSSASHASLWSGSAASWVDLHPAGATSSCASGISGGQQVGWAIVGSRRAGLWRGTAASWVDLHAYLPAQFTSSEASGILQAGAVTYIVGSAYNSATSRYEALMWVGVWCSRGDTNCDGTVNFFDIDPFLLALFDNSTYLATYCNASNCAADVDGSGTVDYFDIDAFVRRLYDPPCAGGATRCNGVCTNTAFDPSNCGGCGIVCPDNQTCSGGICQDVW